MIVNRRLDEWVKLEQLDLNSVETVVDEKVEDKVNIGFQRGTQISVSSFFILVGVLIRRTLPMRFSGNKLKNDSTPET